MEKPKRKFKVLSGDFSGSAGGPVLTGMILEMAFEGCPYKTDWIWCLQPELDIHGRKCVRGGTASFNPTNVEEVF